MTVAAVAARAVAVAVVAVDVSHVEKTVLASGLRVVTERMPEARSVTTGFWVGVGSRDEPAELAGASHFLEHLLFKGTEERSARSIAMAVEAVGGEMNAFTTREHTAYYTRLPAEELSLGLELLADVVAAPAFRPNEIDAEREVIVEEILMNEDAPDDVVVSQLWEALYPDHPLGRETLGSPETIEVMAREQIAGFHREWYRPANLVVAAAGDLHHDDVVAAVEGFLATVEAGQRPARSAPGTEVIPTTVVNRSTEQAHLTLGWRALHFDDPERYALWVANHVLGGGTASRLFQEIREEHGLAYTVFSSPSSYQDSGALSIYAGTAPDHLDEVLDLVDDVIEGLRTDGPTDEEFAMAVGYLVGSLQLGLEDSGSRMMRLGASEIQRGMVIDLDEHVRRIRAVTPDDARRVLERVVDGPRALAIVGPFEPDDPRFANR